MSRYSFWGRAVDQFGNIKPSTGISVFLATTATPATIYLEQIGGSGIDIPPQVTTDNSGRFNFWLDDIDYAVSQLFDITVGGLTYTKVDIFRAGNIDSLTNDLRAHLASASVHFLSPSAASDEKDQRLQEQIDFLVISASGASIPYVDYWISQVSGASVEQDQRVREYAESLDSPSGNIINRAYEYTDVQITSVSAASLEADNRLLQLITVSGGIGIYSQYEKFAIEMEMEFKAAQASYYKELTYVSGGPLNGALFDIDIWTDSTKVSPLFHKDLYYNLNSQLSRILLTRLTDSSQTVKFLSYNVEDKLESIDVSAYVANDYSQFPPGGGDGGQAETDAVSAASREQDSRLQEQIVPSGYILTNANSYTDVLRADVEPTVEWLDEDYRAHIVSGGSGGGTVHFKLEDIPSGNIINRATEYTDVLRVDVEDVDGQLATHLASADVHFLESDIDFNNIGISAHAHPQYDAHTNVDGVSAASKEQDTRLQEQIDAIDTSIHPPSGNIINRANEYTDVQIDSVSGASREQDNRVREFAEGLESPSGNIINRANEYTDVLRVDVEDVDGQLATHLASADVHFLESDIDFNNIGVSAHGHPQYDAHTDVDSVSGASKEQDNRLQEQIDLIDTSVHPPSGNIINRATEYTDQEIHYEFSNLTLPTSASQDDLRFEINQLTLPTSASQNDLRYEIHNLTLPTSASIEDIDDLRGRILSHNTSASVHFLESEIDIGNIGVSAHAHPQYDAHTNVDGVSAASDEKDQRQLESTQDLHNKFNLHITSGAGPGPTDITYNFVNDFTEVDSGSDITLSATQITFDVLRRDANSYVYLDVGVGEIGDFEYQFEARITSSFLTTPVVGLWGVSNTVPGTWADHDTANDGLNIYAWTSSGTLGFFVRDFTDNSEDSYLDGGTTSDALFFTVIRSDTTITVNIYSDAARETLIDSLTTGCPSTTYRYLYGLQSRDSGVTPGDSMNGYVKDLVLIGGGAPSGSGSDPWHIRESDIDIGNIAISGHSHPQYSQYGDLDSLQNELNTFSIPNSASQDDLRYEINNLTLPTSASQEDILSVSGASKERDNRQDEILDTIQNDINTFTSPNSASQDDLRYEINNLTLPTSASDNDVTYAINNLTLPTSASQEDILSVSGASREQDNRISARLQNHFASGGVHFGLSDDLLLESDPTSAVSERVIRLHTLQLSGGLREALDHLTFYQSTLHENFNAYVKPNGNATNLVVSAADGGDLTAFFQDGHTTLTIPASGLSIRLDPGSRTVPKENFVYIDGTTKELTLQSGGDSFPQTELIKVAYLYLLDDDHSVSAGALVNQNWNDELHDTVNGHMSHITENIRLTMKGSHWHSGITPTVNITSNGGEPDNVDISTTSGVSYQMHRHLIAAMDTETGDIIHVVNDDSTPYKPITDLNNLLTDATGSTMAERFFNLVIWAVANKTGQHSPLMVNLPGGSYFVEQNAINDVDGFDVYDMPHAFNQDSSTGFLIARLTFKHSSAGSGTWTLENTSDLRGLTPGTIAGAGGIGQTVTEFTDTQFKILDDGDTSKTFQFEASGINTGTNRTLTIQDTDGTIALIADLDVLQNELNTFTLPNSASQDDLRYEINNLTLPASASQDDILSVSGASREGDNRLQEQIDSIEITPSASIYNRAVEYTDYNINNLTLPTSASQEDILSVSGASLERDNRLSERIEAVEASASQITGTESLANGITSAAISISEQDDSYILLTNLINSIDNPPSIYSSIIIKKGLDEFRILFSGSLDSDNYKLDWGIFR